MEPVLLYCDSRCELSRFDTFGLSMFVGVGFNSIQFRLSTQQNTTQPSQDQLRGTKQLTCQERKNSSFKGRNLQNQALRPDCVLRASGTFWRVVSISPSLDSNWVLLWKMRNWWIIERNKTTGSGSLYHLNMKPQRPAGQQLYWGEQLLKVPHCVMKFQVQFDCNWKCSRIPRSILTKYKWNALITVPQEKGDIVFWSSLGDVSFRFRFSTRGLGAWEFSSGS